MLDITAVPQLKELTHLPVIVDPSHAAGDAIRVQPLALAAQGVGADGVIIEVHPSPATAKTVGPAARRRWLLRRPDGLARDPPACGATSTRSIIRSSGCWRRRQNLALEIGRVKANRGLPIYMPDREAELMVMIEEGSRAAGIDPATSGLCSSWFCPSRAACSNSCDPIHLMSDI